MGTAIQQAAVRHFAGGDALFSGLALLALAAGCGTVCRGGWKLRAARLIAVVGAVLVALSAVPLPIWFHVLGGTAGTAWLASVGRSGRRRRIASAMLLLAWCAVGAGIEIAFRTRPALPGRTFSRLAVIGDSLSAGISPSNDGAWPARFAEETGVEVIDLSSAGATTRSAIRPAERLDADDALVLVEIGGNDLLAGRSSDEFGADLDRLLRSLVRPGRGIVMLELPLPPLHDGYGRRQRALAAKYDAAVIPRRDLARVLFANGATIDDLHLSEAGHAALAEMVRERLGGRLRSQDGRRP
ncbi:MAG: GDSL-type esterase/lipase family protein [Planctomycetales bacterium]